RPSGSSSTGKSWWVPSAHGAESLTPDAMRVVSVNVSLPKTVEWRGRKVTTAIFKEPVEGRVRILRPGLVGDRQPDPSVHGGPSRAAARDFTSRSTKRAMWPRETRSNYSGRTTGSPRCRRSSTKSEGKNRADSLRDRDRRCFAHLVLLDASPAWK